MSTDFLTNIVFLTKKNQKKNCFNVFFSITRYNKPVIVLATYRHLFSSKLGTLVSEKPWFLTENIDFLTSNLFLELFSYNNVIKAYKERILGQIFTLIPNPGSKTMFDF